MTPERIVALVVGALAICFGAMLLPWAEALRRGALKRGEPIGQWSILFSRMPPGWRAHALPWFFIAAGAALVVVGVVGGE